jgi:hypothetical protein
MNTTPTDTDTDERQEVDQAHPLAMMATEAESQGAAEADTLNQAEAPGLAPELLAGLKTIPLACLRMLRAKVAKTTPEILAHWTDDVLDGPSSAVPPLLMRYAASFAPVLGSNPELAVFVMACVPLGLGYMTASQEHAAKVSQDKANEGGAGGDSSPAP